MHRKRPYAYCLHEIRKTITTLGKYRFPMKVDSLLDIANICDDLSSLISDQNPNLAPKQLDINFTLRLNLILSLLIPLQDDSFKFCNIIKFVYEQLHLLTKEKNVIHTTFYFFPPYCTSCHLMLTDFCEVVALSYCHATPLFEKLHYRRQ